MTREDAIEVIRKEYACVDADCDIERNCGRCELHMPTKEPILKAYDMAISALSSRKGCWVSIDEEPHEEWECDKCGFVIDGSGCIDPIEYRDTYNFCPNCGADMRGDTDADSD